MPESPRGLELTFTMSTSGSRAATPPPATGATRTLPAPLRWLRAIGITEGISTLALFGIAMPLKYGAGMPLAVSVVGSVHGGLFVLYAVAILLAMRRYRWPLRRGIALVAASILPFGPFVLDRRIPRWHAADADAGRA